MKDPTIMFRMYNDEHYTLQEIGDKFGISRERVRQILTKHTQYVARYNNVKRRKLVEYIKEHPDLSPMEIALGTNCSRKIIYAVAKSIGVKLPRKVSYAPYIPRLHPIAMVDKESLKAYAKEHGAYQAALDLGASIRTLYKYMFPERYKAQKR